MYAEDFEYNGKYLSDFNFIICDFNNSSGFENISGGSEITFNKVSREQGKKYGLSSTQYDECIESVFQICKNPCLYKDLNIDNEQCRDIMRWLNRREFLPFKPFNSGTDGCADIWFNASFNVRKLTMNGKTYGLEITMKTDKPFGYGRLVAHTLRFSEAGAEKRIPDVSDEIGITYPDLKIVCKADGDLEVKNITYPCAMIINNCKAGETITVDGDTRIITSSLSNHDISDDFNYEYLRIENEYAKRENKITVSLPCDITLSYHPIIKDTP